MMNTDEEIQSLTDQIENLSVKIGVLSAKQEAAVETARKFKEELEKLLAQQRVAIQQLHELKGHKSGMYMWENIGDGG